MLPERLLLRCEPFVKQQPHKMVKHTRSIRGQIAEKLVECMAILVGADKIKLKIFVLDARVLPRTFCHFTY